MNSQGGFPVSGPAGVIRLGEGALSYNSNFP
jgi:hypothetical protein